LVPRLLEKLYAAFEAQGEGEKKQWKRVFFKWAFRLAYENKDSFLKKWLLRPIADFFVYSNFRKALGGRWSVILCGGAALDTKIYRFFLSIGFPLYEGWGLTEGSFVCVNTAESLKVGTVGKPLPGMKIKIGQDEEVLVSGPTLMKGYYRNPKATQAAIDEEGWLHTGDKGAIDKEGYLTLIGRVKEQFKLSSGEYVSPDPIEHLLCQHPFVDRALVVGEGKKYPVCLLFADRNSIKRRQMEQNMERLSFEQFLQTEGIRQEMEAFLEKINKRINTWENLIHYRFICDVPTVEEGALTPTLKLKREFVLQKYADLIKTIYKGEGE